MVERNHPLAAEWFTGNPCMLRTAARPAVCLTVTNRHDPQQDRTHIASSERRFYSMYQVVTWHALCCQCSAEGTTHGVRSIVSSEIVKMFSHDLAAREAIQHVCFMQAVPDVMLGALSAHCTAQTLESISI
jgi:hypothetical protein